MKFISMPRSLLIILMSLFTISLLSACGGSSDSSSGSGSFAAGSSSLDGNVSNGVAYQRPLEADTSLVAMVYDVIIPSAYASGIVGYNVNLYLDGFKVGEQTTDAGGNFSFSNLAPGSYNVQVVQNGRAMGKSPVIQLDANTNTRIGMRLDGGLLGVEVDARNDTISGEVENESKDDDDQNSSDDSDDDKDDSDDDSKDDSDDDSKDDDDCDKDPSCDDDKDDDGK